MLKDDAVHRAAALFAATPSIEAALPADAAVLGTMPSGPLAVLSVEGVRVCHKVVVVRDPGMAKAMNVYIAGETV